MENELIPWLSIEDWREANAALSVIIEKNRRALDGVTGLATEILNKLTTIFELLDDLGRRFCVECANTCCRNATVWFDYADLVFLHFNRLDIPPGQIQKKPGRGCRYLQANGCRLPRQIRPWICTWYLCPMQMNYLRTHLAAQSSQFQSRRDDVKNLRKRMVDMFIRKIV